MFLSTPSFIEYVFLHKDSRQRFPVYKSKSIFTLQFLIVNLASDTVSKDYSLID